jgi:hypothetical protein
LISIGDQPCTRAIFRMAIGDADRVRDPLLWPSDTPSSISRADQHGAIRANSILRAIDCSSSGLVPVISESKYGWASIMHPFWVNANPVLFTHSHLSELKLRIRILSFSRLFVRKIIIFIDLWIFSSRNVSNLPIATALMILHLGPVIFSIHAWPLWK